MITKIDTQITPPQNDQAGIERVAQQFEGLLLNQVMQAMRRTVPQSAFNSGFDNQVFTSMLDDELSRQMVSGQGLGLAPMIARQLGAEPKTTHLSTEVGDDILRAK